MLSFIHSAIKSKQYVQCIFAIRMIFNFYLCYLLFLCFAWVFRIASCHPTSISCIYKPFIFICRRIGITNWNFSLTETVLLVDAWLSAVWRASVCVRVEAIQLMHLKFAGGIPHILNLVVCECRARFSICEGALVFSILILILCFTLIVSVILFCYGLFV